MASIPGPCGAHLTGTAEPLLLLPGLIVCIRLLAPSWLRRARMTTSEDQESAGVYLYLLLERSSPDIIRSL